MLMFCCAAQAAGYGVIWYRARPESGVYPSSGESSGAQQPQTSQRPHLQPTQHGEA